MQIQLRPTSRIVRQIGAIERFAGTWERLSQNTAIASAPLQERALVEQAESACRLDSSSPLDFFIERVDGGEHQSQVLLQYLASHQQPFSLAEESLANLFRTISGSQTGPLYREDALYFHTPPVVRDKEEEVFRTVFPSLVEQRLSELISWTEEAFREDALHPIVIIGIFHLLFLQIHPFPTANHRISLLLVWQLLKEKGYRFVEYAPFTPYFLSHSAQYFSALRSAERSAYGNWGTLNIWLEFFLESLVSVSRTLDELCEKSFAAFRLTDVQSQILEVIRQGGTLTREKVSGETGINLSTVKYNLGVLTARGHLERVGAGRTTAYRLV